MLDFRNESGLSFTDISSEQFREYRFPKGEVVRIEKPLLLNVSKTGGHRVFDKSGTSHYIRSGWLQLSWTVEEGKPNFVK
jgi:hypothetical protein